MEGFKGTLKPTIEQVLCFISKYSTLFFFGGGVEEPQNKNNMIILQQIVWGTQQWH